MINETKWLGISPFQINPFSFRRLCSSDTTNRRVETVSFWLHARTVDKIVALLLVVAALFQCYLTLATPPRGDASNHIFRFQLLWHFWDHGVLYPRWLPESFHNYGSPAFYFYPPLIYFSAGIVHLLRDSLSAESTFKILSLLFSFASFFSFFFYLRSKHFSLWPSVLGSLLYAFLPYRYLDANVRGDLAEHTTFVWIPLILWGIDEIRSSSRSIGGPFVALAFAWGATLMTNIPAAVVIGCGLLTYVLVIERSIRSTYVKKILGGLTVGTLLAAISLLPALQFGADINQHVFGQTVYRFGTSYTPLLDIFSGNLLTVNFIGILMVGAVFFLFFDLNKLRQTNEAQENNIPDITHGFYALLLMVLIVQLPFLSILLLKYFKPATLVQFPWRFDILIVPIAAFIWAYSLENHFHLRTSFLFLVWQGCLILMMSLYIAGVVIHPSGTADPTWEYFIPRWVPVAHQQPIGIALHPEIWTQNLTPNETFTNIQRSDFADSAQTVFEKEHKVKFHRYYWPQWIATVDGNFSKSYPDHNGYTTIMVPAGVHHITLQLHESVSEVVGTWISLLSALGLGVGFLVKYRLGHHSDTSKN